MILENMFLNVVPFTVALQNAVYTRVDLNSTKSMKCLDLQGIFAIVNMPHNTFFFFQVT